MPELSTFSLKTLQAMVKVLSKGKLRNEMVVEIVKRLKHAGKPLVHSTQ